MERFSPIAQGNRWEYRVENIQGSSAPGAYLQFWVDGDTTVEGTAYSRLHLKRADVEGRELARSAYGVRLKEDGRVAILPLGDSNSPDFIPLAEYTADSNPATTVTIGEQDYDVTGTGFWSFCSASTGGAGGCEKYLWAADIGAYFFEEQHHYEYWRGLPSSQWEAHLIYARIGDDVYGVSVLPTEHPPEQPVRDVLITAAYPNPFYDNIRVLLGATARGPVRIELFDLLGRRVAAFEEQSQRGPVLVAAPEGPAGVYFVRVTDTSGRSATRKVVRAFDR